ncbi:MAG: hypothetical protein UV59_C0042G0002 [Candidatus Gottesmanbacteria bacterium GW2011_GWA1_43_11]|uniref:Uncharacterized protein n=1 Tax=Candidatus Gottesmanbacteria bacterium GW2011_GWA1_43_11 TaxID=1618436 RepID=A0A0G1CCE7_9BACT|nr:MAG: hypothetical protein UV59_C0042G0002 [Candidatus Gottesmanbacteria bacterium GW2011_GWA1_43_11]
MKNLKFSGSDASLTISALKFLGIIDSEGRKTEKMSLLQLKGEERCKAIKDIVSNSYIKLFETSPEANKLDRDTLYNNFIVIYGMSGRQASSAVPNFLWLCQQAGMDVSEPFEVKGRSQRQNAAQMYLGDKTHTQKIPNKKSPVTFDIEEEERIVELGEFKLQLPSDWDTAKARQGIAKGEFKAVYTELTNLSEQLRISVSGKKIGEDS